VARTRRSASPQQLRAQGRPDKAAQAAAKRASLLVRIGQLRHRPGRRHAGHRHLEGKQEGDRKLAQLYLSRMQYAYGPDESTWGSLQGRDLKGQDGQGVNLYAEHLRGTEGAVLSRTSNLYGMLTTDDPFQYLGGIALAVRHLDGKAPAALHQQPARQPVQRPRWKARRSSWPKSWPRASSTPATSRA
jgi:cobaltochelatase CobN